MTQPDATPPHPEVPPPAAPAAPAGVMSRLWQAGHLIAAVVVTTAFLLWLLLGPGLKLPNPAENSEKGTDVYHQDVVRVLGPSWLYIKPNSALKDKLPAVKVKKIAVNTPILNVSGTVVASLRQGNGKGDYWQFNTPEVLTAWTDWQKSVADISFQETQLAKIKHLAVEREKAQKKVVDRLILTVKAGTDSEKDLDDAKLKLIEQQITGAKDVNDQENLVKLARKAEATLARQLQLAGLDPELLRAMTNDADIVIAEVPESKMSLVKVGQECTARFFGIPGQVFSGKVTSLAPVVSKEKRTLRVLFKVFDPKDQVRAGMYGDIGLGTDSRDTLIIPADAVLHIGRFDYVLVAGETGKWRVAEVQVGDTFGKNLEILEGLKEGEEVVASGVILLKPFITEAIPEPNVAGDKGPQIQEKAAP